MGLADGGACDPSGRRMAGSVKACTRRHGFHLLRSRQWRAPLDAVRRVPAHDAVGQRSHLIADDADHVVSRGMQPPAPLTWIAGAARGVRVPITHGLDGVRRAARRPRSSPVRGARRRAYGWCLDVGATPIRRLRAQARRDGRAACTPSLHSAAVNACGPPRRDQPRYPYAACRHDPRPWSPPAAKYPRRERARDDGGHRRALRANMPLPGATRHSPAHCGGIDPQRRSRQAGPIAPEPRRAAAHCRCSGRDA